MTLLLRDGLQQPSKFIVRVDVRTERALDAWGLFLKWGAGEESSRNEIAEEAAQRSMFPFPETGGKAFPRGRLPYSPLCCHFADSSQIRYLTQSLILQRATNGKYY